MGSVLSLIQYILLSFATRSQVSAVAKSRFFLAEVYFNILAYIPWFVVVVLMLKILLKYAKPQSDDLDDEEQRI